MDFKKKAKKIRKDIIDIIYKAHTGHPLGSLSSVEILLFIYYLAAKTNPKNPNWEERDRILVSCGHIAPALYAVMSDIGFFPKKLLDTYSRLDSPLQGHPERKFLQGIEITSGSLGMGLGQAVGSALAAKMDGKKVRFFCVTSDGEHNEGSHWEAVSLASKYRLSNITQIVDRNMVQINGPTEKVFPLEPLKEKYKSFGWKVLETDGHNIKKLNQAYKKLIKEKNKPQVIIAKTVGGKGVSFMEGKSSWHSRHLTQKEYENALEEIIY